MTQALAHRGPDGHGVVPLGPLVLGHRRLAVIDPRPENDQPLATMDRALWVVGNHEIYNFRDLRRELEAKGARFRTEGDTEVILEAYRAWGPACVERFDGMFAFALWDARARRLFLVRDWTGEKPLFYAELPGGGLAFASEPRALRQHPAVGRAVDPQALGQYLSLGYTTGERTLLGAVRRLPAAHHATLDGPGALKPVRYWDLAASFRQKRRFASEAEAGAELNALLEDSVRGRMISDVPLGAFLSGGLDSSTVVAAMTRLRPARDVHTFSMGFDEASYSELPEARAVASALGVTHRDRVLSPQPDDIIAALRHAADEPLADSSVLPMYWLARLAREEVTVILSGDGGDEAFAGYDTYVADRLHAVGRLLPGWALRGLRGAVERLWPVSFGKVSFDDKLRRFLAGLPLDPARAHASWRNIFGDAEGRALLAPAWRQAAPPGESFAAFAPHFAEVAGCHPIDQALYVDVKTWLTDDILVKVDRMTMAHSLEARTPFLSRAVVEFAAALPVSLKLRLLTKKYLLRRSQAAHLPRRVLSRPKRGFNAPVSPWFAGPLMDFARDALGEPRLDDWVARGQLDRLWNEHTSKRRDNGLRLMTLVCFALWLRDL